MASHHDNQQEGKQRENLTCSNERKFTILSAKKPVVKGVKEFNRVEGTLYQMTASPWTVTAAVSVCQRLLSYSCFVCLSVASKRFSGRFEFVLRKLTWPSCMIFACA